MTTIVGEPMSSLPISPPTSPSNPLLYHQRLPSDVLKPNPHPYPIKTTSTAVLSRSNSTTKSNSPYQFYVPQSPGSPGKESQRPSRGDKERRGGRHRYSKSLNSNANPTPLPVPDGFASASGFRERSGSTSSFSSVESGPADVFGEVANNIVALGRRKHRAETMPPSTASAFEASISSSGLDPDGGDKRRGRTYHTMGRRSGGKVRGMVDSFERSASQSGDEEGEDGDKGALIRKGSSHRRTRHRSGSEASDHSIGSSSSSYSSASLGPSRSHGSESKLKSYLHESQEDSTPRRNRDLPREPEQIVVPSNEPTMEQLLASFPIPHSAGDSVPNIETVKLRDAVVEAGTIYPRTVPIAATAPVTRAAGSIGPAVSISTNTSPPFDTPSSLNLMPVSSPRSSVVNMATTENEEELTVEQLLALAGMPPKKKDGNVGANVGVAGGVNAWERDDAGCTVKRIEETAAIDAGSGVLLAAGTVVNGTGRRSTRVRSAKVPAEKDVEKRRLEDVFLPVGGDYKLKGGEGARVGEAQPADRQLRFEQEMSETKEMVRALSARVASVEARIGEMERAAGDLEVRGKKLMSEGEAGKKKGREGDGNANVGKEGTTAGPRWSTRSVVGLARAAVHGALDGASTRLAKVVPPLPFLFSSSLSPSSQAASTTDSITTTSNAKPDSSATRARGVPKTRGSGAGSIPMWYKRSWTWYLLFLGLGACAFMVREVARRGLSLRGRLGPARG